MNQVAGHPGETQHRRGSLFQRKTQTEGKSKANGVPLRSLAPGQCPSPEAWAVLGPNAEPPGSCRSRAGGDWALHGLPRKAGTTLQSQEGPLTAQASRADPRLAHPPVGKGSKKAPHLPVSWCRTSHSPQGAPPYRDSTLSPAVSQRLSSACWGVRLKGRQEGDASPWLSPLAHPTLS